MSKALFDTLLKEVDKRIAAALAKWRPDLRKTTGALPVNQVPIATPTDRGGVTVSASTPQPTGTAAAGSGSAVSAANHVHAIHNHDHVGTAGDGGKLTAPVFDSYAVLEEIAAPSAPAANTARFYAKDAAGVTELYYQNSSGTERDLSGVGTLTSHNHTAAGGDGGVLTNDEHDGFGEYTEIAAPSTPAANKARLYAKDKAGVSELYYKNDAGTERDLSLATGASTSAEFLTTASDGSLSAEVVIPGLAGSPDRAGIGGGGITEEWDSGTTGLTWAPSTPATVDSDTTIPSHLYVLSTDNTQRYGTRTFAPGAAAAFDVRCKVADLAASSASGTVYAGLHIQNSDNSLSVLLAIKSASGIYNLETYTGAPGYTIGASRATNGIAPYLRISRDGSNNVSWWFSYTGLVWTLIHTASFTFTPALAGLFAQGGTSMNAEAAVDWFRSDVV